MSFLLKRSTNLSELFCLFVAHLLEEYTIRINVGSSEPILNLTFELSHYCTTYGTIMLLL